MIGAVLRRLVVPRRLSPSDARMVFRVLVDARTTDEDRCAVLVALSARPDNGWEWATLAGEMRRRALPFHPRGVERAMDLCGSGGAPRPSFNVSTVSAFVVAASGQPVIKHGNRSSRGPCGSSNLLLALGLPIDRSTEYPRRTFAKFGIYCRSDRAGLGEKGGGADRRQRPAIHRTIQRSAPACDERRG